MDLKKKIDILENVNTSDTGNQGDFEMQCYRRFNKNLKARF